MSGVRTVGVEEELLLVDPESGAPLAVAGAVLRWAGAQAESGDDAAGSAADDDTPGGTLEAELQQQQVETDTPPQQDLGALEEQLRAWRRRADDAARHLGARVAALGTSPLSVTPLTTLKERYQRMLDEFGITVEEQLTCGCHVHVSIDSREEGVAALDRVRDWLPVLAALSANSPYWQGRDSRYASYRTQAWGRWPSAGPTEVMGSVAAYDSSVQELLDAGVLLDHGMVYFDARLSVRYPTLEVRVADVCLEPQDAVLVAGLVRALIDTAARAWRDGVPPLGSSAALLRMAAWRASRSGVEDGLVDPRNGRPAPAAHVVAALLDHVGPALEANGDAERVTGLAQSVLSRGSGATRQRATYEHTGTLAGVVADAVEVTCPTERAG